MADENNPTHDSQAQRSARKRYSRRSEYWDHFEHKAECKYCKAMLCADPARDGTSSMKTHYEETCPVQHPKPGRQHVLPAEPAQSVKYGEHQVSSSNHSPAHLDRQIAATEDQLVRMIALHGHPSSVVEDAQFRRFAQTLCPDFEMPSRGHVEERCDALFDQELSDLKDALGRTPGIVILSLGEDETARGQVYIAAHFIDGEWNLHRRVIQVFKASNGEDKPSYDEIKHYDAGSVIYGDNYVRLKETISCWGLPLSVLSDCWDLRLLRNKLHFDNVVHLSATQYKLFSATDINCEFHWVARLLTCIEIGEPWLDAFRDLSLSQKKRRDISSRLSLNNPWTYDEWWYACYYALEILHDECSSEAAEIAGLAGGTTFQETELTESCRTILGTIYRAIEAISACSSPTSNLCLIELLKLKKKLGFEYTKASRRNDVDDDNIGHLIFTRDLKTAKEKLEEFLSRKYLSLSIPLVLDPRFKLRYVERIFKAANLAPDWSSDVRVTIHQLFIAYSIQGNEMDVDPSLQAHPSLQVLDSTWQVINPSGQEQQQQQAHLSSQECRTELDAYLQDETVPIKQQDFDILKWWKGNCHRYPTIARMARDFLAIPTSTRLSSQHITEITNHLRRYA